MRPVAFLLAIILSTLMVQPAFTNFRMKADNSSCTKNKPVKPACSKKKTVTTTCSKNKCSRPKTPESGNNCGADRCNPLLGCPSGNFYLLNHSYISLPSFIIFKQKNILVNDNRISKQLTECWHPPEII